MQVQVKTRYWLIIIGILIILFFLRDGCNKSDRDRLIKNITSYSDTVKFERLKNGALISTNNTLQLSSQDQLKSLVDNMNDTVKQMFKRFKTVNNITYVTNTFAAGGDTLKYAKAIPCDFKPFKVAHIDLSYTFRGTVYNDHFRIDTIVIPNSITLISGRKRVGFLKYDNGIDINNSNPLMIATNIRSYQYAPPKKWFEKTWVHLAVGALIETGLRTGSQVLYNTYIKR